MIFLCLFVWFHFQISRSLGALVQRPEESAGRIVFGPKLNFAGDGFPCYGPDELEGEINACGYAGRRPDLPVPHDPLLAHLDITQFGETR
jgi:hypothetical protein